MLRGLLPHVLYSGPGDVGVRTLGERAVCVGDTPGRSLRWRLKSYLPHWKVVFQPPFFRVKLRNGIKVGSF